MTAREELARAIGEAILTEARKWPVLPTDPYGGRVAPLGATGEDLGRAALAAVDAAGWGPPGSDTTVRDEVVGAWCLLDRDERQEVDDVAPDLVRVLEQLTREAHVEAFEREVGPGTAAPC